MCKKILSSLKKRKIIDNKANKYDFYKFENELGIIFDKFWIYKNIHSAEVAKIINRDSDYFFIFEKIESSLVKDIENSLHCLLEENWRNDSEQEVISVYFLKDAIKDKKIKEEVKSFIESIKTKKKILNIHRNKKIGHHDRKIAHDQNFFEKEEYKLSFGSIKTILEQLSKAVDIMRSEFDSDSGSDCFDYFNKQKELDIKKTINKFINDEFKTKN